MKNLLFNYDFYDLKEIIQMEKGGLDFRFYNSCNSYQDLSVETNKWENIQEFLEWYKNHVWEAE